jgi:hypothetical protein
MSSKLTNHYNLVKQPLGFDLLVACPNGWLPLSGFLLKFNYELPSWSLKAIPMILRRGFLLTFQSHKWFTWIEGKVRPQGDSWRDIVEVDCLSNAGNTQSG